MRILIISTFFPPLNSIASLRPYSWAKYWSQAGHEVTVLTTEHQADPSFDLNLPLAGFKVIAVPFPRFLDSLRGSYRAGKGDREVQASKKTLLGSCKSSFIRLFNHCRFKYGIFNASRMPDFTDLWIRPALKAIRKEGQWDLVVSTSGPYAVHLVAEKLKKGALTKRWVADFRDKWSDSVAYSGLWPFSFIEKILERKVLRSADAITTVSTPYAGAFQKKYPAHKVFSIMNGFDSMDLEKIEPQSIFAENRIFRIVYTGSIYPGKQNLSPLFLAIQEMNQDPSSQHLLDHLEILFVGQRQANLEQLIEEYGVGRWVRSLGAVNREEALRMQRDAHALLFLPWNDLAADGILTGKIFEYLFSGTPIIAVGAKEMEVSQRLIRQAKAGYLLPDVVAVKEFFSDKLSDVRKEPSMVEESFLSDFDRKALAMEFLQLVGQ